MRTRTLMVAAMLLAATLAAGPGVARGADDPLDIHPVTTDRYDMLPEETFHIRTGGGDVFVALARPDVPRRVKVPVILTYTPYAALGYSTADGLGTYFGPKGYARAIAHVVGTGESGGCWDYGGYREQASAVDLVEFLGTRAWSNGKVGMIGGSYDGTTANMAAVANPPHLATIVPEVAISQWYGYAYHDGVRYFVMDPAQRQGLIINEQGFDTPLGFDFGFGLAPPLDPFDEEIDEHFVERLCPGLEKMQHTLEGYNEEPDFGLFWYQRDYLSKAANLAIPDGQEITVLVQGGWRDYNVKHSESSRFFEAVPVDDPNTVADEGVPYKMMVMSQAAHGAPDPEVGWDTIVHAWFDRWLLGHDTGIDRQPMSVSRANDGELRVDASWPPPGTADVRLFMRGDGSLQSDAPTIAEPDQSFVDTGLMTESDALALRDVPNQNQVLWYVTEPLLTDLRISGLPHADLGVISSTTSTHFTPVLFDLGEPESTDDSLCTFVPAQDACTMSRGFLNARYRRGLRTGHDVVPNQPYRASARFIDNDWVVKAGHQIGVAIMSSNMSWALPDQQRATNTILSTPTCKSALVLPIVGGRAAAEAAGL